MYSKLFSPMKIGGCEIKNRIVMSPMLMGFGQIDGRPTEMLMDYYEERAKGGTGLIITEITRVNDVTGASSFGQLAMSHDYHIEPMREFAERIHRHGAKLFVQLHHPGRQNVGLMVGTVPISVATERIWKGYRKMLYKTVPVLRKVLLEKDRVPASAAPSKVEPAYFAAGRVRALSRREIKKLVEQFVAAAVRCKKAGVDGVELHGTHGYLIQQFLSPNTNKRTDEYGGSFENRLRFLREIVEGIRRECGDYPIIVRLTVDECYDRIGKEGKGYGLETGVAYAKAIEAMGVDAIDVSSASYDTFNYWLEPTSFESGWRKYMAAAVKKEVGIPVLAADIIRTPDFAEQLLEEGVQDFVSLGRPQIADPHWANKAMSGNEKDIRRCICCLYCIESMQENAFTGGHGYCSVNPTVGKEREYYTEGLEKNGNGRKIVIAGAGCAGLTAAGILAERGFDVTVLEKEAKAGGQLNLASMPPHKERIGWCAEDLERFAKAKGAEILYGTEATAERIAAYSPYAVITATGAVAVRPRSIPGVNGKNVYTTTELLTGAVSFKGKKIALIGSGMTGLETAELIAPDNELTIVEMADAVAPTTWFQHRDDCIPKLKECGTKFLLNSKLVAIDDKGVELTGVVKKGKTFMETGETVRLECDAVVLSLGSRPVNALAKELDGICDKVYTIGDAERVGRIADATRAGYELAASLE